MCSAYVGIAFLKAVQKMNKVLEEQGVKEQIPHLFGEHENLMNLDIFASTLSLETIETY